MTRTKMLTIRASEAEKQKIRAVAESRGMNTSQFLWQILDEAIADEKSA